jgi:hypothetical protein
MDFYILRISVYFPCSMRNELAEMLRRDRFTPFVVTMNDGFAIAIPNPEKALVAANMLVVLDEEGQLHHLPFRSIAHFNHRSEYA